MPAVSVSFCCLTRYRRLLLRSLTLAGRCRCSGLRVADGSELAGMSAVSSTRLPAIRSRPASWWPAPSSKCSSPARAAGSRRWSGPREGEVEKSKRFSQSFRSAQVCDSAIGRNKPRGPFQAPRRSELERLDTARPPLGAVNTIGLLHLGHLKEFLKNASKII